MNRQSVLEKAVVTRIMTTLKKYPGVVVRKRHGTAMGVAGDPDLYGTIRGRHFEIEVKRPNDPSSQLTELQTRRLLEWKGAGAITGVARSVDDALAILGKYGIQAPPNVYSVLSVQRTLEDIPRSRVTNVVIANNDLAANAARTQAEAQGYRARVLRTDLQGEARMVGARLADRLRFTAHEEERPACMIVGGETTVTILGSGKGGRNQELALAAVAPLAGLHNVSLITMATDGDDGPTDAAGAVVTGETAARAQASGLNVEDYLARNDSYHFFEALGDLLRPGYTGTNVNDLVFLLAH
jgi:glycerate-2-kinase